MDEKDRSSTEGNSLVPTSEHGIARRSDSLVARGLRDLDAAEQEAQDFLNVLERLEGIHLGYGRGTADSELSGFWQVGDPFTVFEGDSEPDGDDIGEMLVLDLFLVGNDDLNFWNEMGDPAAMTQEKLRGAIQKYRSKLLDGQWPGRVRLSFPRSEANRIFVGADLFSSSKNNIPLGLAIWSTPTGADVEIDGRFVGDTESGVAVAITTGEHSVVVRKAGHETWSRKLNVRVPDHWDRKES